jgi:hypothetical protein
MLCKIVPRPEFRPGERHRVDAFRRGKNLMSSSHFTTINPGTDEQIEKFAYFTSQGAQEKLQ